MDMGGEFRNNLSNKQINELIDSLCTIRMENPDVLAMDNINNQRVDNMDPFEREQLEIETDRVNIEADILRNIFENTSTPMSFEEMNELKAKGLYDKYMDNKNNKGDMDMMNDIERELQEELDKDTILPGSIITDDESVVTVEPNNREEESARFQESDTESTSITETEVSDEREDIIENIDTNEKNDEGMTVEEINDVPASTLKVDDKLITKALNDKYNITDEDALQLIRVMNRYKAGENFDVFESLPISLKSIITKSAMEAGADKSLINFFAKTFINDLVSDVYMDYEFTNFQNELKEVSKPLGNIVGTIMDEYTDELIAKFETNMRDTAKSIEENDPDKAAQLYRVANNFADTYTLDRLYTLIITKRNIVNIAYKEGRDNWNKVVHEFKKSYSNFKPALKDITFVVNSITKLGYPESIAKTLAVLVYMTIKESISINTVEEHVYSYYILNGFFNLSLSADNSKLLNNLKNGISTIIYMIANVMKSIAVGKKRKNYPKDFIEFIDTFKFVEEDK